MLAQEIIRHKREGQALSAAEIQHFVSGLVTGAWSDSQAAALAMAIVCRGMQREETVQLTRAMTDSGERLSWAGCGLNGPILDKHSTGGVGDKVSLVLAPLVAACGGIVPMISGRGLGHTGGTLDKLEALPGYQVEPSRERLLAALRHSGCAIVGASAQLAPADRRLYAIRDVTATVESLPLITASILSKKLAAGLQALVMDVKTGGGAFAPTRDEARALARSLVDVATDAGLPTVALITDMQQPLGWTVGHALEVREALQFLNGTAQEPRLRDVTLALAAQLLLLGGLAADQASAQQQVAQALATGAAAEHFARMVAALGGPANVLTEPRLPSAPVCVDVLAATRGWVQAIDARALGLIVLELGGGRRSPGDLIDPRVGLSALLAVGQPVELGQTLVQVHAGGQAAAQEARQQLQQAIHISPVPTPAAEASPVLEHVGV